MSKQEKTNVVVVHAGQGFRFSGPSIAKIVDELETSKLTNDELGFFDRIRKCGDVGDGEVSTFDTSSSPSVTRGMRLAVNPETGDSEMFTSTVRLPDGWRWF